MVTALVTLIVTLLVIAGFYFFRNIKMKAAVMFLVFWMIVATGCVLFTMPTMHKEFAINVVEYLIKINDDGSLSTTKKTTQTIIQRQQQTTRGVNRQ